MSGKVILPFTETQGVALVALALGDRIRAESPAAKLRLVDGLRRKGLVYENGSGLELTELGKQVAALCASLVLAKLKAPR